MAPAIARLRHRGAGKGRHGWAAPTLSGTLPRNKATTTWRPRTLGPFGFIAFTDNFANAFKMSIRGSRLPIILCLFSDQVRHGIVYNSGIDVGWNRLIFVIHLLRIVIKVWPTIIIIVEFLLSAIRYLKKFVKNVRRTVLKTTNDLAVQE